MGAFNPFVLLAVLVAVVGLLALAVSSTRRLRGTEDAIVVTGIVAALFVFAAASLVRDEGWSGGSLFFAAPAAVATGLFGQCVYRVMIRGAADSRHFVAGGDGSQETQADSQGDVART